MTAGFALVPGLALMIVSGLAVVPVAKRYAPRVVVPIALGFSVVAYVMVALSTADLVQLIVAFALLGIGIGAAETVSNELILSSAPSAKAGAASAVSETAYEVGAVLGTAVLGGILAAFYRAQLVLPEGLSAAAADASRETLAGAVAVSNTLDDAALADALRAAAAHAFDSGVVVTALIGAVLIVVAGVIAATTLGGTRSTSTR